MVANSYLYCHCFAILKCVLTFIYRKWMMHLNHISQLVKHSLRYYSLVFIFHFKYSCLLIDFSVDFSLLSIKAVTVLYNSHILYHFILIVVISNLSVLSFIHYYCLVLKMLSTLPGYTNYDESEIYYQCIWCATQLPTR